MLQPYAPPPRDWTAEQKGVKREWTEYGWPGGDEIGGTTTAKSDDKLPPKNTLDKYIQRGKKLSPPNPRSDSAPGGMNDEYELEDVEEQQQQQQPATGQCPPTLQYHVVELRDGSIIGINPRNPLERKLIRSAEESRVLHFAKLKRESEAQAKAQAEEMEQKHHRQQRSISKAVLTERRNKILERGWHSGLEKLYDKWLVDHCRVKAAEKIKSLDDLYREFYSVSLRKSNSMQAFVKSQEKTCCRHILREYYLPFDFEKDPDTGVTSTFFGASLNLSLETRVCMLYGLLLLEKKNKASPALTFVNASALPLLSLSANETRRDFALRNMDRGQFQRTLEVYVQWRKKLFGVYLSFSERARLARLNSSFRSEFGHAAQLIRPVLSLQKALPVASSRTLDEILTACRCISVLSGKALARFVRSEEGEPFSKFPSWVKANDLKGEDLYSNVSSPKLLETSNQIQGKTPAELMRLGGNKRVVETALGVIVQFSGMLGAVPPTIQVRKLPKVENLALYHALWARVSDSGTKKKTKKALLIGFLSQRRVSGLVEMETEAVRGKHLLFLRIRTVGGSMCLVGIEMHTGMVYIHGQVEQGASTKLETAPVALKKCFAEVLQNSILMQQIAQSFKTCAERLLALDI